MQLRKICLSQIGNHETVTFAISELTRYLRIIDPELFVEQLLMEAPEKTDAPVIWVGMHPSLQVHVPAVENTYLDDAIAICVENGNGYITGSNERSVLIAAYRFLNELGCRWLRPGDEGFRVTHKALDNITVQCAEVPSYRYRNMCIEGAVSYQHALDMIDYLPKVGMNEYMMQFMLPSTFFERWYEHENNPCLAREPELTHNILAGIVQKLETEIAKRSLRYHKVGHGWNCTPFGMDGTGWHSDKEHVVPEDVKPYLAQLNGVRQLNGNSPMNTQLCYSKPEVRNRMTDYIVQYAKDNPHVNVLHVWDADNIRNHCECDDCAKLRPSDWYLTILNELDEKLTAEGLPAKIAFVVSRDKLWSPLEVKLHNPDRFLMMFAPITRTFAKNYGHCLEDPGQMTEFIRNGSAYPQEITDNVAYLRQWQDNYSGDIFLFDYHLMWAHVNDPGYERCARQMFDDIRNLHNIGIHGFCSCQVQRAAFPTNLPLHITANTLWNRDCDYNQVADQYYLDAFGKDGGKVRAYLSKISEKVVMMLLPTWGTMKHPKGPFCTDYKTLYRLIDDFLPVIREHAARNDAYAKEWKYLELHSKYTTLYLQIYEKWEQSSKAECLHIADQVYSLLQENEYWAHPVIDVRNQIYVLARRLQLTDKIDERTAD